MESSNVPFEVYVKNLKFEQKEGYVDIKVCYEIKTDEIEDYVEVYCFQKNINCPPPTNDKKKNLSIREIVKYTGENKPTKINIILKQAESQVESKAIQQVKIFLQLVEENIKNYILFPNLLENKGLPIADVPFVSNTQFTNQCKAAIAQIQRLFHPENSNFFVHFLETPVSINQCNLIRIQVRRTSEVDLDELNPGRIFDCNHIGCIGMTLENHIEQEDFNTCIWKLLPKHCTFIIKTKERFELTRREVKTGYWRYSDEFMNALQHFLSELQRK